jgi:esterase
MPDVRLRDIRLYFEEHGHGKPVLCIHGTSSSALIWGDAVGELARLGRVIVYDRRGCTRSERPEPYDRTSVSQHAADAAGLLDALAATPAIVIGRSYGGEVAIELSLRYPDKVAALVLLEAALSSLTPAAAAFVETLRATVEAAAERDPSTVGEVFIRAVLGDAAWENLPEALRETFRHNGPAILAETRGAGLEVRREELGRIDRPTLVVGGADSPEAFALANADIAATIPAARTLVIGGGHLINPADPGVLAFVKEVLATEARRQGALDRA